MGSFSLSVASNLVSAALISIVAVYVWPSRTQFVAALRSWLLVKDVTLYLSMDGGRWNIEVPRRYVQDVKWRLRAYSLRPTNFFPNGDGDDTRAFDFRIATYDQSHDDDVLDISREFKSKRIAFSVLGGFPSSASATEEF